MSAAQPSAASVPAQSTEQTCAACPLPSSVASCDVVVQQMLQPILTLLGGAVPENERGNVTGLAGGTRVEQIKHQVATIAEVYGMCLSYFACALPETTDAGIPPASRKAGSKRPVCAARTPGGQASSFPWAHDPVWAARQPWCQQNMQADLGAVHVMTKKCLDKHGGNAVLLRTGSCVQVSYKQGVGLGVVTRIYLKKTQASQKSVYMARIQWMYEKQHLLDAVASGTTSLSFLSTEGPPPEFIEAAFERWEKSCSAGGASQATFRAVLPSNHFDDVFVDSIEGIVHAPMLGAIAVNTGGGFCVGPYCSPSTPIPVYFASLAYTTRAPG